MDAKVKEFLDSKIAHANARSRYGDVVGMVGQQLGFKEFIQNLLESGVINEEEHNEYFDKMREAVLPNEMANGRKYMVEQATEAAVNLLAKTSFVKLAKDDYDDEPEYKLARHSDKFTTSLQVTFANFNVEEKCHTALRIALLRTFDTSEETPFAKELRKLYLDTFFGIMRDYQGYLLLQQQNVVGYILAQERFPVYRDHQE